MEHKEITEKIIGCAYRVYNQMGFGFLESVYEKCLLIELRRAGLTAESQIPIHVFYDGENVGEFIADIVVEGVVILELKSVRRVVPAHEIQVVNYLTATQKEVGLLLNFGPEKVEVKRKVRALEYPGVNPVDPVILSKNRR
jgi:GxxExxY protein